MLQDSPDRLNESSKVLAAFYKARIAHSQGDDLAMLEWLERSLRGSAKLGYDSFLVVAAKSQMEILEAISPDQASTQLKALVRNAQELKAGKSFVAEEDTQEATPHLYLEVRCFGEGEIRLNGDLLPPSAWRSSRARALFFYILDRGKARKETIGLDFWPDFSPGKVSSNFHATLWRVRQALGSKQAIQYEEDRYALHPSISIWYDVAEFERLVSEAETAEASEKRRQELLAEATRLYQGTFLGKVYMEWTDRRREELQSQYIIALQGLAGYMLEARRFRQALDLYKQIVDVDPYRDQVHLAIMDCLVQSGSPSAARAHFLKYKQTLHDELNAEPTADLQAFIDGVRS